MNRDVCLLVEGALLERLMERALAEGAVFARVRRRSARKICIDTDSHSADLILSLCRKYALNCRILHRGGRTALLALLYRRWTLLPGLALGILLCGLFLSRIWIIDLHFTTSANDASIGECIYACLEENGVQPGASRAQIDTARLQSQICASVGELSYVGVRLQGIRLLVEASLETPVPELYALADERDLLAEKNGVIESIAVYSGEACVQPGDTVLRGDVLIRGIEDKSKEESTPVGARGEVIARCWYEGKACAPLYQSEQARTGRQVFESCLRLGNFSLTLADAAHFANEECETKVLPIVGLFLPLEFKQITRHETVELRRSINRETLELQLGALARADALRQIQATCTRAYELSSAWTDAQVKDGLLRIRAVYEIYTDIAVTRDALIEEVY